MNGYQFADKAREFKNTVQGKLNDPRVQKVFNGIREVVERIIAKCKGIMINLVAKLKSLYASALEKIGKFVNNKAISHTGDVKVTWYQLQKDAFNVLSKEMKDYTDAQIRKLAKKDYHDLKNNKYNERQVKSLDEYKNDARVFKLIKDQKLTPEQFKVVFSGTIMSNLNKAYTNINRINSDLLKLADDKEKEANESGVDETKEIAKSTSIAVHNVTKNNILYMNSMFSIAIFGFHQALKATLVGLGVNAKNNATTRVSNLRNTVQSKFQRA